MAFELRDMDSLFKTMDMSANVEGFITLPRAKLTPDNCYTSRITSRRQTPRPRSEDSTRYYGDDSQDDLIHPPYGTNLEKERFRNFDPPTIRRLQAFCSLYAHHLLVVTLIALLQGGCALWQGFCMWKNDDAYYAFGPGVATISVMDGVVKVVCFEPHGKQWCIRPGQYILLLMPPVSKMQWHPFTVSSCGEGFIELHIKCTGGWTERLRQLAYEQALQRVYLSGPFGAPAQRYSDYRQAIMIGCGIGITPMSAILQSMTVNAAKQPRDLALPSGDIRLQHLDSASDRDLLPDRVPRGMDDDRTTLGSEYDRSQSPTPSHTPQHTPSEDSNYHLPHSTPETRDIDFHLIVREQRNLAAFTRLFDSLYTSRDRILSGNLGINLSTYLTGHYIDVSIMVGQTSNNCSEDTF
ncbi:hypothetical protein MBLNU13_g07888t2 [Cladosporium sp. NU13]